MLAASAALAGPDAWARALVQWAEGSHALYLEPDPRRAAALTEHARLAFLAAGHNRNLAFAELCSALAHAALGEPERAEAIFTSGIDGARRRQEPMPAALFTCFHALLLVRPHGGAAPGRAATVTDPEARARFLERVPENAEALARAHARASRGEPMP